MVSQYNSKYYPFMRKLRQILLALGTFIAAGILCASAVALAITYHYSKDLPDYRQLAEYNPATTTRLYANDGTLMEEYALEKRLFVPIEAIPKRLVHAFIAAEDKNFYHHPGIDFMSIFRAAVKNVMNLGQQKPLAGGSTITQQVVKNFLLTKEQSLSRKIKEAILSFRITQAYTKERILELYLNEIYLGAGSYGVAAAALNYFNKSIDELSAEEAAMLAGLPKAPGRDDPRHNYDGALKRRNYVLHRMHDNDFITQDELRTALAAPITLTKRDATTIVNASYFSEYVRRDILTRYGEDTLYTGGLTVITTLNPGLQAYAQQALHEGLVSYDKRHGWRGPLTNIESLPDTIDTQEQWLPALHEVAATITDKPDIWHVAVVLDTTDPEALIGLDNGTTGHIKLRHLSWARPYLTDYSRGSAVKTLTDVMHKGDVVFARPLEEYPGYYALRQIPQVNGGVVAMDPHTGKIVAMTGGFSQLDQFNRATQAQRQPGSAIKPFVYLSALEQDFTPTSIIVDAEIEFDQGDNLPGWKPQNYSGDYYGPSTLRLGVERSRNAMTVRLAQILGLDRIIAMFKRFGIYEDVPYNYSVVLGSAETSLLSLTSAYAMLVNGGKEVTPAVVERIQDHDGVTVFARDARTCDGCNLMSRSFFDTKHILTPPVIADERESIIDPLSAFQMVSILEGVVQRGTGMEAKSLGYTLGGKTGTTNDGVDSWFIGFSPDLVVGAYVGFDTPRSMGKNETGASVALPIFIDFMEKALKEKADIPFRVPADIELVRVDKQSGLLPTPSTPASEIILEAFKPGTAPTSYTRHEQQQHNDIISPTSNNPSIGHGGIY